MIVKINGESARRNQKQYGAFYMHVVFERTSIWPIMQRYGNRICAPHAEQISQMEQILWNIVYVSHVNDGSTREYCA